MCTGEVLEGKKLVSCDVSSPQLGHLWILKSPEKEVETKKRTSHGNARPPAPAPAPRPRLVIAAVVPADPPSCLNDQEGPETIAPRAWKAGPLPVAPSSLPPSRGCTKSYNHTTLISPRMEGVVMATEHFLKHRNGVPYCSVSLAVAERSVWQAFSI